MTASSYKQPQPELFLGMLVLGVGWTPMQYVVNGPIHIMPDYDLGQHYFYNCPCCPDESGSEIVHNSFDGREKYEGLRKSKWQ